MSYQIKKRLSFDTKKHDTCIVPYGLGERI